MHALLHILVRPHPYPRCPSQVLQHIGGRWQSRWAAPRHLPCCGGLQTDPVPGTHALPSTSGTAADRARGGPSDDERVLNVHACVPRSSHPAYLLALVTWHFVLTHSCGHLKEHTDEGCESIRHERYTPSCTATENIILQPMHTYRHTHTQLHAHRSTPLKTPITRHRQNMLTIFGASQKNTRT